MAPAKPALLELAYYLRRLREEPAGTGLTQAALARALGGEKPLAPATVASWENRTAPKLPSRDRILAYAQFFATPRSLTPPAPRLVPIDSFTEDEREKYDRLRAELLRLHAAARGADREMEVARRSWFFSGTAPITLICPALPPTNAPAWRTQITLTTPTTLNCSRSATSTRWWSCSAISGPRTRHRG